MSCPAWSIMQSFGSIIVSVINVSFTFVSFIIATLMDMESVIKSNTNGMREIVTKLEKAVKDKKKEIDQLKKINENITLDNEKMKKEVSILEIKKQKS